MCWPIALDMWDLTDSAGVQSRVVERAAARRGCVQGVEGWREGRERREGRLAGRWLGVDRQGVGSGAAIGRIGLALRPGPFLECILAFVSAVFPLSGSMHSCFCFLIAQSR